MRTDLPPIAEPAASDAVSCPVQGRPDSLPRNVFIVLLIAGISLFLPAFAASSMNLFVVLPLGGIIWAIAEDDYHLGQGRSLLTAGTLGLIITYFVWTL